MARSLPLSIIDLAEKRKSPVTLVPFEPLLVGRDPQEAPSHLPPDSGPIKAHHKIKVRSHYISASQLEIWMDEDGQVFARDNGSTNPTLMAMEPRTVYKLPRSFWLHVVDSVHIRGEPRIFECIPDVSACKRPEDLARFVEAKLKPFATSVQIVPTKQYKNQEIIPPRESFPLPASDAYLVVAWDPSRTRGGEVARWLSDCVSLFNAGSCTTPFSAVAAEGAEPRELGTEAPWKFKGSSAARQRVREMAERVAAFPLTVLLQGPSGAGKGVLSYDIHRHSHVASGPFMVVDLAALAKDVMESELFGSVPGGFTNARDKMGLIEKANGGTLFLDEIGELTLDMQKKLLHVLQDHEVRRVGDTKYRKVRIRVVAATLRDLSEMVKAGTFREDLYFRLAQIVIRLPAPEASDFAALVPELLKKLNQDLLDLGAPTTPMVREEISRLSQLAMGFARRGGIRELENTLGRYLVFRQPDLSTDEAWQAALQSGSEPLVFSHARTEPRMPTEREPSLGELGTAGREKDRLRYLSSLVGTMLFLTELRKLVLAGCSRGLQQELASALGMTPTAVSTRFKGWGWPLVPQIEQIEEKLTDARTKLKPYAGELRRMLDTLED